MMLPISRKVTEKIIGRLVKETAYDRIDDARQTVFHASHTVTDRA